MSTTFLYPMLATAPLFAVSLVFVIWGSILEHRNANKRRLR